MSPKQKQVLEALESETRSNGEFCANFFTLSQAAGLPRAEVRRITRFLARQGLAEYRKGLIDEDGEFAGAGYCITERGKAVLYSMMM